MASVGSSRVPMGLRKKIIDKLLPRVLVLVDSGSEHIDASPRPTVNTADIQRNASVRSGRGSV
jgi:hypothetical protein